MSLELIDIGVNLDHASFHRDRQEVITRAAQAGIRQMVLTGTTIKASRANLTLAREYPQRLFTTAGVHPHNARFCDEETINSLRRLAKEREVVAIGECGLDFNRDFSPRPVQEQWFEAQVALAAELQLPLFLHERDAHARFIDIIKKYRKQLSAAVVHCFTGNRAELDSYLSLDLHIGITGWICDERRGLELQQLIRYIPLDRLMLETDAPFLLPRTMRPRPKEQRNEPAYLTHVLAQIAKLLGHTAAEVAAETTKTAVKFFQLEQ